MKIDSNENTSTQMFLMTNLKCVFGSLLCMRQRVKKSKGKEKEL